MTSSTLPFKKLIGTGRGGFFYPGDFSGIPNSRYRPQGFFDLAENAYQGQVISKKSNLKATSEYWSMSTAQVDHIRYVTRYTQLI